jgi:hypothetical protein
MEERINELELRIAELEQRGLGDFHEDNRDIDFTGNIIIRNRTVLPTKGRPGQIIMKDSELYRWDSGTSAFVLV